MNNAEKFKQIFGLYATELWSMPESDFLEWLNRAAETAQIDHTADIGKKAEKEDCISRQAAIDALDEQIEQCNKALGSFDISPKDEFAIKVERAKNEIVQMLPSAQPDNQINLCDSCDYLYPECPSEKDDVIFGNGIGNDNICACNKYKPSAQPESTRTFAELVVRYPAPELCAYEEYKGKPYYSIKYIENGEKYVGYSTYNPKVLSEYIKKYFMPSVQPEQNGKWIYNSPTTMKCDRCGFAIKDWDWHRFKFCPNCGADMRGKQDGHID